MDDQEPVEQDKTDKAKENNDIDLFSLEFNEDKIKQ